MLTYGFFNAVYTEGIPDRSYTADNLAEFFESIIGDGVSADIQDGFKVVPSSGMQVDINPGFAWIHGYYAKNTSLYPMVISAAPPTDTRIDAVVLRWSRSDRNITPQVLTGVASPNPQRPQIVRSSDTYDLLLGYITLNAGDSAITSSMITDTRPDVDVCGIIDTFAARLLPDNSVTMEKLVDGAVSSLYTATIPTSWVGSEAPYSIAVTVNGIKATDSPIVDLLPSTTYSTAEKQIDAWGGVYRVVASANTLTFYATDKPEVDIPIQVRCIRK